MIAATVTNKVGNSSYRWAQYNKYVLDIIIIYIILYLLSVKCLHLFFVATIQKHRAARFFEVFCLLRKTRELCPIAAAIKYLYPKTSMRGYPKYNILLYIIC